VLLVGREPVVVVPGESSTDLRYWVRGTKAYHRRVSRRLLSFYIVECYSPRRPQMAVDRNERVLEMVEEALREDSEVSNRELQERAAEIDPRIGELSGRSFNARYPLQVKRKLAAEQEAEGDEEVDETSGAEERRTVVRQVLIDFARDVAGAEYRSEMLEVLRDVDKYVDRVIKAG
jgi:hypothetical protein